MTMAVSSTGASIQTANGPQSLLSGKYPMTKLDTINLVSFQTIRILFNHEPPQPDLNAGFTDTLLYQFKHGYSYPPAIWMTWQNPSPAYPAPPTSVGASSTTFYDFGDETASSNIPAVGSTTQLSQFAELAYDDQFGGTGNYTNAFLYCVVDATNVSIYVRKTWLQTDANNNVRPIFLIGVFVNIRIDVFTEPATTSTY